MALEDKALTIIQRGAITYDALRAELGASPDDLDAAIVNLERARSIKRNLGRLHLTGAMPAKAIVQITQPAQPSPAAAPVLKKKCSKCEAEKPVSAFGLNKAKPDGRQPWCSDCQAKYQRERTRLANEAKETTITGPDRPIELDVEKLIASAPKPPVMILHFADGVRVGPVVTSLNGLAQMPYHVDLSADQVEELVTWWRKAKGAAA